MPLRLRARVSRSTSALGTPGLNLTITSPGTKERRSPADAAVGKAATRRSVARRARGVMPATVRAGVERILDAQALTLHGLPVTAVGTGLPRIPRPALARRLADGLGAGSVLLVAGAGYGKTMALEEAIA